MKTNINDCSLIELDIIPNKFGNITVAEFNHNIPFQIKRVYYLYDVPGGEARGGHAHKQGGHQLIIAASGSFEVLLEDGVNSKIVKLNKANNGLLLVPGLWREIFEFSSGAVCLVLASYNFDESDYIRDHKEFLEWKL